ncbi:glycosyltransferase family 1 protein [Leptotrichia sp. OH3620_COT-345]|uniref:glycosyltransferase n=1 Tax=Leptotrichia sp. OH3620_COT-345 TaxID=2491048 RepID=UPI000F6487E7|nr:glycosyltransferase [Leptotrichia sp. OH3620_COT-345]RRD40746.1 glycosyltransferase family 1 protein [Leptotrichia sp. OH3620_COT-345]
MTNVLIECPELISSVKIGVLNPLEYSKKCNVKFKRTSDINKNDILWSDILISVRGSERASLEIMKAALYAKRYTIMFLDDDLINIPLGLESTKYFNDKKLKKYILEILTKSHVLWAVNPKIIEKYASYTINKKGILTKVPMKIEIKKTNNESSLKVLYAGSTDHKKTIQKIIKPMIEMFSEEINEKKIAFTFIGANPGIKNTEHYEYFHDYDEYKRFVKNGNFNIGLAPIETTEFYKSKYYNKFLEYTSIGVLGIYTNSEPYNLIVKNKENGILCENKPEVWYKKIKYLLENPTEINRMIKNAQKKISDDFNNEVVSREILKLIPELSEYKAPEVTLNDIRLKNLKWIFYGERIKLIIRIYGIKSFLIIPYKIIKKIIGR